MYKWLQCTDISLKFFLKQNGNKALGFPKQHERNHLNPLTQYHGQSKIMPAALIEITLFQLCLINRSQVFIPSLLQKKYLRGCNYSLSTKKLSNLYTKGHSRTRNFLSAQPARMVRTQLVFPGSCFPVTHFAFENKLFLVLATSKRKQCFVLLFSPIKRFLSGTQSNRSTSLLNLCAFIAVVSLFLHTLSYRSMSKRKGTFIDSQC